MYSAVVLTTKLALLTSIVLLLISIPLAWWLVKNRTWYKAIIEVVTMLPLVLPPTVLGFYLLLLLSPNNFIGQAWHQLTGYDLVFNFTGLLIGSILYSFPFVLQPIKIAFEQIDIQYLHAAALLKAKPIDRFINIVLPMAKHGLLSGFIFGFAHTLGEFGVVLMIGGNIPGETQVLSILIYDEVEQLNYHAAALYSGGILFVSAGLILMIFYIQQYQRKLYKWQN